ncbi:hypothetical protein JTB14_015365 [Gonioctena quinquepunctata]|nr:hypothetical protein JTB14_015365 [Gonioctena quinquepunctata]
MGGINWDPVEETNTALEKFYEKKLSCIDQAIPKKQLNPNTKKSLTKGNTKTENTLLQVVAIFLNLAKPRAEYIQALLQPTQQLNLYEEEKIDKSNQLPLRNISDTQTNQVNNTPQTSVTTRKAVKPKETRVRNYLPDELILKFASSHLSILLN